MRIFVTLLISCVFFAPVSTQAAVSASVQSQIEALLRQLVQLQAQVKDGKSVQMQKPSVTQVQSEGLSEFEVTAGGSATLTGTNLMGASVSKTKVSIGGKRAAVTGGDDSSLTITVPPKLKKGKTYNLYLKHEDGKSNRVKVTIAGVTAQEPVAKKAKPELGEQEKALKAITSAVQEIAGVHKDAEREPNAAMALAILAIAQMFVEDAQEAYDTGDWGTALWHAERAEEEAWRAGKSF